MMTSERTPSGPTLISPLPCISVPGTAIATGGCPLWMNGQSLHFQGGITPTPGYGQGSTECFLGGGIELLGYSVS